MSVCGSSLAFASDDAETQQECMAKVGESSFELSSYSLEQIEPMLPLLEEWLQRGFGQYPYLWRPSKEEKVSPGNRVMLSEKNALVTCVRKGDEVVAIAGGIAMEATSLQDLLGQTVIDEMKKQGYDPSQMVYMSYFLTAPEYLNEPELVEKVYNHYTTFAKEMGKSQLCFFEYFGSDDHPLKPNYVVPIEPWGYVINNSRNMNIKVEQSWPTLQVDGSVVEEAHQVEFFVKDI